MLNLKQAQAADPAVAAYDEWRKAHAAYIAALAAREADDDPVVDAANEADHAAASYVGNAAEPRRNFAPWRARAYDPFRPWRHPGLSLPTAAPCVISA